MTQRADPLFYSLHYLSRAEPEYPHTIKNPRESLTVLPLIVHLSTAVSHVARQALAGEVNSKLSMRWETTAIAVGISNRGLVTPGLQSDICLTRALA
jgi:hypothetical protein